MPKLIEQAADLHRAGQLEQAIRIYRRVLAAEPNQVDAQHNLGFALLSQGQMKEGEALVREAWTRDSGNAGMAQSPAQMVELLLTKGYREQARFWIRAAVKLDPQNAVLAKAWEQSQRPDYLAPEILDEVCNETLLRYAPRESERYLYSIDIVGTCNLKCPSCPVGNSSRINRAKGTMSVAVFESIINKILKESPSEKPEVWLFNWGEPTLHPQLVEIVEILKSHGLPNMVSTNLNYTRGVERLAHAAPDRIKISLSGFHPETYNPSHSGGDIGAVKQNMKLLRKRLDELGANSEVWVGHHLYHHNYHEKDEVRVFAESLGYQWVPIQAFWQPIEKLLEQHRQENIAEPLFNDLLMDPIENAAHIRQNRKKNYDCELRFNQTAINFDGSVALCCSVYNPENMLQLSFLEKNHQEIEKAKYSHGFCKQCRGAGFDYSISELPHSDQRRPSP